MPDLIPYANVTREQFNLERREAERQADIRATLGQLSAHYAAALPFLRILQRLDAPCYGRDWEDVIAEAEDVAEMTSPKRIAELNAELYAKHEAVRRAEKIAAAERASALEKAMQS